jgi:hypothetical protein
MPQKCVISANHNASAHVFHCQAKSLQFLDLSQTNLDKKAVDDIIVSLTTVLEPGLISLHLDDCSLRVPALDVLSKLLVFTLWSISAK